MSEVGIKELKELMGALEVLAVAGCRVGKDGKIGADDLMVLIDLLKEVDTMKDAFTGLSDLPAEVKDLKEDEIMEIVMGVFAIVKKIKEALA